MVIYYNDYRYNCYFAMVRYSKKLEYESKIEGDLLNYE